MERDRTQVTIGTHKTAVAGLFWGMDRWPTEDIDVITNRLMRRGWQVIELLHQGDTLRTHVPLRGPLGSFIYKLGKLEILDDSYACPDRYIRDVTQPDVLDQTILALSSGQVQTGAEIRQGLRCQLSLDLDNVRAAETYALDSNWVDAINRLIQMGYFQGLIEDRKGWIEYRPSATAPWRRLPSV